MGASLEVSYPPADGVLRPDVIPHLKVSRFSESLWCCIVVVSQLASFKAVLEVFRSCDKMKSAGCQKTSSSARQQQGATCCSWFAFSRLALMTTDVRNGFV